MSAPAKIDWKSGTVDGQTPLYRRMADLRREWNRPFTAAEITPILRQKFIDNGELLKTAKTLKNKDRADILSLERLNEALLLAYIRCKRDLPPNTVFQPDTPEHQHIVNLMVSQVGWVSNLVSSEIKAHGSVRDLPADIMKWMRDQLSQGLGIPSWVIPVGIIAVGAIVVVNLASNVKTLLPKAA